MNNQDTTIVGKADNAKLGAVIVTAYNEVYYIEGLESWSNDLVNKSVIVSGKVVEKKIKSHKEIVGKVTTSTMKIIKKPKIEIYSDT